MIVHLIMLVVLVLYMIPAIACWRTMTGYAAWRIHTTAEQRSGITPELEDWVVGALLTMLVAIPFWWLAMLFRHSPVFLKHWTEREGERLSSQIRTERLRLDSERQLKELDSGDE